MMDDKCEICYEYLSADLGIFVYDGSVSKFCPKCSKIFSEMAINGDMLKVKDILEKNNKGLDREIEEEFGDYRDTAFEDIDRDVPACRHQRNMARYDDEDNVNDEVKEVDVGIIPMKKRKK